MRLLYCIPDLGYGGAERQLSYLAAEMVRMGHEVHVASRCGGPNLDRLKSVGVVWHWVGGNSGQGRVTFFQLIKLIQDFVAFFRLLRLIRKLRPDIVQTILAPMDMLGGAAALLTRTPWVLKECSAAPLYAAIWKYTGDWRCRVRFEFGKLSDAVVSNSAGGYDYWRAARAGRSLQVIPNAIPLDEIADSDRDRVSGFAFGPHEKVVLYAGRIDLGKNVENVIAALARIADEVPFTAIICGDGSRRSNVERMAGELGIAHRIVFTGYVDNLWDLMKRADAFVSLSRFEGCPNVVLEAMACGCPLIVSDIPAHREILDEHSALFANPDKLDEVAAALKATLMCDDETRSRARAAQESVAGRPLKTTARLYEHLYLRLIGGAHAPVHKKIVSDTEAA